MLKIYDSLTQEKRDFVPVVPGKVSMYVCGMTVYDHCHIGHSRLFLVFDMVARYLQARGYEVNYVRNITDINDKILNRAHQENATEPEVAERFIELTHRDERALNMLPPTHEPRASQHIQDIILLIQALIDNGYAYVAADGDVCFEVRKFQDYGKLSKRNVDELQAGARLEIDPAKRDPLDFVLWKKAKPNEPVWPSPWGEGRPGWHIECSAMSYALLGQPFDIHGGGMDLKFPHHENEIAQSEGALKKQFAHYWMHNGLVRVGHDKMSKSLGNFLTIQDALKQHDAEVLRYFILSPHYRSPVTYTEENIQAAKSALDTLYTALNGLAYADVQTESSQFTARFHEVMDDDFNTPQAVAILFEMAREINRLRHAGENKGAAKLAREMVSLAACLGILQKDPQHFLQGDVADDFAAKVERLIVERNQARASKDWASADRIRDELAALDVVIEDSAQGTTWRRR